MKLTFNSEILSSFIIYSLYPSKNSNSLKGRENYKAYFPTIFKSSYY